MAVSKSQLKTIWSTVKNSAKKSTTSNKGTTYEVSAESKPSYSMSDVLGAQDSMFDSVNKHWDTTLKTDNPFDIVSDYDKIKELADSATNASYDTQRKEANQNLNSLDNTMFKSRVNTLADLRKTLLTGAIAGGNTGAMNATILSSILAGDQANTASGTAALQELQNLAGKRQATLTQNAADALEKSNSAKKTIADINLENQKNLAAIAAAGATATGYTGQGLAGATTSTQYDLSKKNKDAYENTYITTKLGDSNSYVKKRQEQMKELGLYTGKADGVYDKNFQKAVLKFDKLIGYKTDGVLGKESSKALDQMYKEAVNGKLANSTTYGSAYDPAKVKKTTPSKTKKK